MQNKTERIVFLDLLRTFAVLLMIEGHTVDVFLADKYRQTEFVFFQFWNTMRGFTAPIFMFTAGVVFTYLLTKNNFSFRENPRIKKGFKRGVSLICLGYLLRFPTINLFRITSLSVNELKNLFIVDALHLIGMGLITIIILNIFFERYSIPKFLSFIIISFLLLVISPVLSNIVFSTFLPNPIAAYLNSQTGSFFPLFPWLGYVTSGAALGIFLAKKNTKKTKFKFLTAMLSISFCLFIFSIVIRELHYKVFDSLNTVNWLTTSETDLHRLSVVILLASVLFAVSIFTVKIPSIILNFGRYSLTIYVVHLVILYGSVISIGINNVYSHQSGIVTSIVAALIMIFAMGVVSLGIDKFKLKRRYKLSHRLKLIFTELI